MSPRVRWIIIALAIVGFGFASSSAWVHHRLLTDPGYTSICDVSETFNCSQVYLSQYGSVGGVPVALAGMFWFGLVALIAMFSDAQPGKKSAGAGYVFALSTVGLAVVLYLGYTSWFVLKQVCLFCVGTYVSVIGIFIASGLGSPLAVTQLPGRLAGDLGRAFKDPMVPTLALLLVGGLGYMAVTFPKEGTRPAPVASSPQAVTDFASAWALQPRVDLGIPADGAQVVIVKFNDYQCGACRITHDWYKPVLEKYAKSHPGGIKYVLKDWPWDPECNYNRGPDHQAACEAAAAVRMARDVSPAKADELEKWIFDNQERLTPALVKENAQKILGISDFDRRYPEKKTEISRDIADGVALGIRGTPTMFINGVRIEQLISPDQLDMAIQLELNKAAGK
jgi:uncharacterized membrane protein/protein-disulfide isomerase